MHSQSAIHLRTAHAREAPARGRRPGRPAERVAQRLGDPARAAHGSGHRAHASALIAPLLAARLHVDARAVRIRRRRGARAGHLRRCVPLASPRPLHPIRSHSSSHSRTLELLVAPSRVADRPTRPVPGFECATASHAVQSCSRRSNESRSSARRAAPRPELPASVASRRVRFGSVRFPIPKGRETRRRQAGGRAALIRRA